MRKTKVDGKLADALLLRANQFPNPEIAFDTVRGKALGASQSESRFSVSQLIEIGGKRSARIKVSSAAAETLRANSVLAIDQAKIQSVVRLVRYRQLVDEIAVLEEAIETYEKVDRQFRSRPRLSPDQQVSASIIRLALGDNRHRHASLISDQKALETYLRVVPELNFEAAIKLLPKRWKKWPTVSASATLSSPNPRRTLLDANLKQAEANYDLARANAWPDPKLSFIVQDDNEGAINYRSFGFGIAFPLPLWNVNGGAKEQAAAEKYKADIEYRTGTASVDLARKNLATNYQNFVSALEKSPDAQETDRKHRDMEGLFYRGVISGALVIEAHRQLLDFTLTANELELEALEALLNLYSFDGKLAGFKYE